MKYWKNNSNVLSLPLSAMILLIVEEIMETEFKCPRWTTLKILYVLTYFLCPALITLGLSLSSQPTCILWFRSFGKCSYRQKGEMLCKVFLPPLIWIVILLWDGRYIECIVSRSEVDSNQNANQTRAAESITEFYSYSQISGLLILTFVVIVYSLFHTYPFWCCCKSEEECRKEELKNILEEKIRKHVKELQNESIERTMEEEVKPLLQNVPKNFWRDVDFKTAILKIKETLRNVFRYTNIGTQEPTKPCVCI